MRRSRLRRAAQPLAVHLARRVRAQEGERLGDVVGVGERRVGLSGCSARICGVTIALTTTMFAVPPVLGERPRRAPASTPRRPPWRPRRRRCSASGRWACDGGDEHEAPAARAFSGGRNARVVCAPCGTAGARRSVPVLQRRLVDRLAAAPAADEVHEPVDARRTRGRATSPSACARLGVEQVDRRGVVDAVAQRRERVGARRGRSRATASRRRRPARATTTGPSAAARAGDRDDSPALMRPRRALRRGRQSTGSSFCLQRAVEHRQRELVGGDQVDVRARVLDVGEVARLARPRASRSPAGT